MNEETKAELKWAIANNADRPRTQMALRWALEALEANEKAPKETTA
jgi:hypothetical protein